MHQMSNENADEQRVIEKLPIIYMAPLPPDRARRVVDLALEILYNLCPEDPADYLCAGAEELDEEICVRCWERLLFRAINGR